MCLPQALAPFQALRGPRSGMRDCPVESRLMADPGEETKPRAGACHHDWVDQESPYVVAQVCKICMLYRYKASQTSDWEYRAPIPYEKPGP